MRRIATEKTNSPFDTMTLTPDIRRGPRNATADEDADEAGRLWVGWTRDSGYVIGMNTR